VCVCARADHHTRATHVDLRTRLGTHTRGIGAAPPAPARNNEAERCAVVGEAAAAGGQNARVHARVLSPAAQASHAAGAESGHNGNNAAAATSLQVPVGSEAHRIGTMVDVVVAPSSHVQRSRSHNGFALRAGARVLLIEVKCGFQRTYRRHTGQFMRFPTTWVDTPQAQHQLQVAVTRALFERTYQTPIAGAYILRLFEASRRCCCCCARQRTTGRRQVVPAGGTGAAPVVFAVAATVEARRQ